ALGAHVGGARVFCQSHEFGDCLLELRRQHIVGIVAEALVAQRDVRRLLMSLLAVSAQRLHPEITNPCFGQTLLQRLPIKLRQPPRHREGPNINQSLNLMRPQRGDQFVDSASRVSDGVENSHGFSMRKGYEAIPRRDAAINSSCSANTVRRSSSTRSSSTRVMIGGSDALSRAANSSGPKSEWDNAISRVGKTAVGAAPPPITDSPSITSTVIFGDRACAARASARLPISSFVSRIIFSVGMASWSRCTYASS